MLELDKGLVLLFVMLKLDTGLVLSIQAMTAYCRILKFLLEFECVHLIRMFQLCLAIFVLISSLYWNIIV